ncbi:MAG: hypothetical protein IKR06_02190 [Erysipelotrichaceae bacterium]|nr:hypothetical protein [Erysipelotrichaceae bacterium]MBR4122080.1 hypothetical protein [Erysipelotrichaceae bacterium]
MKVTDFYPIFYTNDVEAEIERYAKDLGFALKHRPEIEFLDYAVLENKNGRRIDLVCSHFPSDSFTEGYLGMRANVNDFEAGVSYFAKQGYAIFGEPHETAASIVALLNKGEKDFIVLFHHK